MPATDPPAVPEQDVVAERDVVPEQDVVAERRIAAFDFDGTLTRRDTLVPFLVYACGRSKVASALAAVGPGAVSGRFRPPPEGHHRDRTKERLLARLFTGDEAARVAEAGVAYAARLPALLRTDMAERLAWHQREGHEVVIVSASLCVYLEPFATDHRVNHVLAVSLEADDEGRLTGRLVGPNVRGAEKAVRLRAWLDGDRPLHLWAYGNSSGDDELLEMATSPTRVGRRRRRPGYPP